MEANKLQKVPTQTTSPPLLALSLVPITTETVYFSDRKLKHEARAVTGEGPGPWVRDVIVNFIRSVWKI